MVAQVLLQKFPEWRVLQEAHGCRHLAGSYMECLEREKLLTQIVHYDDQKSFYKKPEIIQVYLKNNKRLFYNK